MTGHELVVGSLRESPAMLGYWLLRCSCGYSVATREGHETVVLQEIMDEHWAESEGVSSG